MILIHIKVFLVLISVQQNHHIKYSLRAVVAGTCKMTLAVHSVGTWLLITASVSLDVHTPRMSLLTLCLKLEKEYSCASFDSGKPFLTSKAVVRVPLTHLRM